MMSNICLMDPGDFLVQMDQSDFNGFSSVSSFFWPPDLGYNPDWCSAGISTKRFCISSSAKRWSVSDLSADLCDLCDLRFSSHVIPVPRLRLKKPILPVDISVHALSQEEPEEIRGTNGSGTWGTAPHHQKNPDSNPSNRPRRLFQKSALDCTRLSNLDVASLHPR
jgi:hypothetical protein